MGIFSIERLPQQVRNGFPIGNLGASALSLGRGLNESPNELADKLRYEQDESELGISLGGIEVAARRLRQIEIEFEKARQHPDPVWRGRREQELDADQRRHTGMDHWYRKRAAELTAQGLLGREIGYGSSLVQNTSLLHNAVDVLGDSVISLDLKDSYQQILIQTLVQRQYSQTH